MNEQSYKCSLTCSEFSKYILFFLVMVADDVIKYKDPDSSGDKQV